MKMGYEIAGRGEPIVLLHGSMANKEQWQMLARDLTPHYTVITLDLMGYGQTAAPADLHSYCLKDESDLLASLLKEILPENSSYHLLGHSYGGAVALHHAYHYSNRVASLVVLEPMAYHLLSQNHVILLRSQQMVDELKSDISQGNSIHAARKFIDLWGRRGTFEYLSEKEQRLLGEGVKKMVFDFKAASEDPLTADDYAKLSMPACLIASKTSPPYSLAISEVVAGAVPGIQLHWVDGGHFAPLTHPHLVNPIVKEFLMNGLY